MEDRSTHSRVQMGLAGIVAAWSTMLACGVVMVGSRGDSNPAQYFPTFSYDQVLVRNDQDLYINRAPGSRERVHFARDADRDGCAESLGTGTLRYGVLTPDQETTEQPYCKSTNRPRTLVRQ